MKLYALHDKKAQMLSSFHVERSDAQASRGFADAVNAKDSVFAKYPEDFELVAVAEIEESTAVQSDPVWPVSPMDGSRYVVVLTASQVVALRSPDIVPLNEV